VTARLPAVLAALALAGCATTGKEHLARSVDELAQAPVCCKVLGEARRLPLPAGASEVTLDKTSQAFDFGGTKAFFTLYELPPFRQPYSVAVTSVAAGAIDDVALLVPRMATYDAQFNVVRYFDEKSLRNRGNNLERTVFVNEADSRERYIAVYGSDLSASVERAYSMVTVTPVMVGPVMWNVYGGKDGTSTLRSSPSGKLKLEVRGLAP
jgi:hypothetical protein